MYRNMYVCIHVWETLVQMYFHAVSQEDFCPLEVTQPYAKYSCSVILSALLMRLGYVTNSVFLPMSRFERTENDVADNVNSNISPWLFYHHFNSTWSHYARQLIRFRMWFKGQWNIDHSILFWYEEHVNAVSKAGWQVQQQQPLLHSCCPPSQVRLQGGYSSQCHLVVFFLRITGGETGKHCNFSV